MILLKSRINNY